VSLVGLAKLLLGVREMEDSQLETKRCPACAEEILIEAKKCKHCGEILGTWSEQPAKTETGSGSKSTTVRTTLIVTGVLVALGAGVFGAAWVTDIGRNETAIPQLEDMVYEKRFDLQTIGLLETASSEVECVSKGISWWGQVSEYECIIQDRRGNIVSYQGELNWETDILRISLN
jgi:hypothetical protein